MRLQLPSIAAVVLTTLAVSAAPAFADGIHPHSRVIQKVQFLPKGSSAAVFECETKSFDPATNGPACYGPKTIRTAYGLAPLIKGGYTGAGQTIVILEAFGSPTAQADLHAFDAAFGLNDPPSFIVQAMPDTPPFDPSDMMQVVWAAETSLDVQWAHAMAPRANIVVVAAASSDAGDLLVALNFAINKRLGDIISMSFGASETFFSDAAGQQMLAGWEKAFKKAHDRNITLVASSGDEGATNAIDDFGDILAVRNVSYPASSPHVTAVGGTDLLFGKNGKADPSGAYVSERVWNEQAQSTPGGTIMAGASGGGVSALFERPEYQRHLGRDVRTALSGHRGIPDVSLNAGTIGGVVVRMGFAGLDGFYIMGGTSASAAEWAGVVADINQLSGRQMGFLNDRLYRLGRNGVKDDDRSRRARVSLFHDITVGDNSFDGVDVDFNPVHVVGFNATPGWDLTTGWGTPNLSALWDLIDDLCNDNDNDRDNRR